MLPKVMLIDAGTPYGQSVGEILLQILCSRYPQGQLIRFCLVEQMKDSLPKEWLGFPLHTAQRPAEWGMRRLPRALSKVGLHHVAALFSGSSAAARHLYIRTVALPRLLAEAIEFGKNHNIDLIWATLTSPTPIFLARRVAEALKVPLVVTVWDPPELFIHDYGLDDGSAQFLLKEFAATLQAAERCSVVSEGMQQEYHKRYAVDPIVLRHGVDQAETYPPAEQADDTGSFTIGYAGSLYATVEWNALLRALDSTNWCISGRQISIRMLGSTIQATAAGPMRLEYLGWRSVQETIRLMSQVDVCYLPYWFDKDHSQAVRLSFPTKLTTYLASGRPVFYHGPEDSSPTYFLRRFPAGVTCHSLEPNTIIESLNRLIVDADFYRAATHAGSEALEAELGRPTFLSRFADLLGVSSDTFR